MEEVIPGCEEFHIHVSDKACLLLHGLWGSPYEFSKLSDFLVKKNYTVNAPRYQGHGTYGKVMDKYYWLDWYNLAESRYLELRKNYKNVYVIGFSTGATITLKLAQKYDIEKIVSLSAFIYPTYKWFYILKPEWYLNTIGRLINYIPSIKPPNINDPIARKEYIVSEYLSIKTLRKTFELVKEVEKTIFNVTSPILIVHSKKDITTSYKSSYYIYENVSSKVKELLILEKSNHIIMLDYEKDILFEKIFEFLEKKIY
ncbi:MAG: carboxylesterase [Candidatus Sericytochromatia bacterium]|nr:MAG: carboxylesterase [Candidatus Sericytochromatia bacterium]